MAKKKARKKQSTPIVESVGSGAKLVSQGRSENGRPSLLLVLIKFGTPIGMLLFAMGTVIQILNS